MSEEMTFEKWLREARRAGKLYWCYEDLVDDQGEFARKAYDRGDEPYQYVKELGEELDLHKFGSYWGI